MWPPAPQAQRVPTATCATSHLPAAADCRDTGPGSGVLSYKGAVEAEGGEDTLNGARDGLLHLQPDKSQTSSGSELVHAAAHGAALRVPSLGRHLNRTSKSSNQDTLLFAKHLTLMEKPVMCCTRHARHQESAATPGLLFPQPATAPESHPMQGVPGRRTRGTTKQ